MNKLDEARDKAIGRVGTGCVRTLEEAGLVVMPAAEMETRAGKLLVDGAAFCVVKYDEPYFSTVYSMIRQHEKTNGTWTDDDEERYRSLVGDDSVDRMCYSARCPECSVVVGAMLDTPHRRDDVARFVSLSIRDGLIIERLASHVAREQFGECTCNSGDGER